MLLRYSFGAVLAAFVVCAQAQSPAYHFFRAEQAVAPGQIKLLIEALVNVDPYAEIFHSDDMTILQVKHNGSLTETAARSAITGAGVAVLPGTPSPEELGSTTVDPNGPPVYVITGDDAADMARYQVAVEQWNTAHPEQQLSTTPIHRR
jgi:hypothetical protein